MTDSNDGRKSFGSHEDKSVGFGMSGRRARLNYGRGNGKCHPKVVSGAAISDRDDPWLISEWLVKVNVSSRTIQGIQGQGGRAWNVRVDLLYYET